MIAQNRTAADVEQLRRRIVADHELGLRAVAEGDEVLAVYDVLDRQRADIEQLRDALRAVREAITVPYAATAGGETIRGRLLIRRAMSAEIMLSDVLDHDPPLGLAWEITNLRKSLAAHPATGYVINEQAQAALAEGEPRIEAVVPPTPEPSPAADEPAGGGS
ncbi:hypothetical protein ACFYUV_38270 [Nonomuraea sp. NPDC003560]|uniref:hypothetical protein n=1 Tax=Nonomuraea sp. NPDC003560 TaxID=3364341 RepID=UPI0036A4E55F